MREWAEAWNPEHSPVGKLIDPALLDPIQAHYIARPRFVGLTDPLVVRSGIVRKARNEVPIRLLRRSGSTPSPANGMRREGEADRDATGLIVDGREEELRAIRWRQVRDRRHSTLTEFVAAVWDEFSASCATGRTALSGNEYTPEIVASECRPGPGPSASAARSSRTRGRSPTSNPSTPSARSRRPRRRRSSARS